MLKYENRTEAHISKISHQQHGQKYIKIHVRLIEKCSLAELFKSKMKKYKNYTALQQLFLLVLQCTYKNNLDVIW